MKQPDIIKSLLTTVFCFLAALVSAQVKIGDNVTTVGAGSSLELENDKMGLVVTRVANTAAIAHPVNGMVIYDLSANCLKSYENGRWTNCLSNGTNINPSTNGTGVVSSYTCSGAQAGMLYEGMVPAGVIQFITAHVTQVGTYNITAISNGVVFWGSGSFTGTGPQNIVLTASGSPTLSGTYSFVPNTLPTCSFSRNILNTTSHGIARFTSFSCDRGTEGTPALGIDPIGVNQTIRALVTVPGTYAISTTTSKGIMFSGSGTVAAGTQDIVLTALGIPTAVGLGTYTLNTTPACSFSREISYGDAQVNWSCNSDNSFLYINTPATTGKNVTANVVVPGSYLITTNEVNGVSYSATGFFSTVGNHSIQLTPSGTPQNISSQNTFTLNALPSCTFNIITLADRSTNGTATVSTYTPIGSTPKVMIDTPIVPGIKQRITAMVTKTGTYSIQAAAYGLTFAATGSFTTIGAQQVILEATGAANTQDTRTFNTNTLPNCSFPVEMYSTRNWMAAFPNETNLSQLTIPGTHDSAAQYDATGFVGSAKAQELTIAEQLNAGVRFLDIRCCIQDGQLRIYHGAIDQQLYFSQVFDFITTFLTNNPQETIVLSIKQESGLILGLFGCVTTDEAVKNLFNQFMAQHPGWWNNVNEVSNLGQARRKITLMSRVSGLTSGLQAPFEDNTTFYIDLQAKLRVQDYYGLGSSNDLPLKWSRFYSLLGVDEAHGDNTNRLYLNFASGNFPRADSWGQYGIPDLDSVWRYMNPKVDEFFNNPAVRGKYGTLILDYMTYDIARKMVKTNFYQFGEN